MNIEWIDKIEVVKRQIKESVRLFFENRDPIAIHTLIASAHQILFDLGQLKGIESIVKNTKTLEKKEVQKLIKAINYPYNFFKHAQNDPNSKINIAPLIELTEDFILDAIIIFQKLEGSIPFEAKVYWFWFVSKHPEGFNNLPKGSEIRKMQEAPIGEWDFSKILDFIKFVDIFGGIEEAHKAFTHNAE